MQPESAPLLDFGGDDRAGTIHFAHANGYPPGVYRVFLEELAESHRVIASLKRPLWSSDPPERLPHWGVFADDLIATLDAAAADHPGPVVGVGHSMGAVVTLLAANRRPDLFSSLILIEPAFLARRHLWMLRLMRRLSRQRIPLISRTLRRRDQWDSQAEAFAWFRAKPVFSGIHDTVLRDYVSHGTYSTSEGGRKLTYDKHWEAHCYASLVDHVTALRRCSLPVLGLRGADTTTLTPQVWRHWQRIAPEQRFLEVPEAGHLLPLEKPRVLARILRNYLPGPNH